MTQNPATALRERINAGRATPHTLDELAGVVGAVRAQWSAWQSGRTMSRQTRRLLAAWLECLEKGIELECFRVAPITSKR